MSNLAPFIHKKTVVLYSDQPVEDAARAMEANGIGCVMVADRAGHIVGLVTDRDLSLRVLAHGQGPHQPISRAMTRSPASVSEEDSVESVITLMATHGIRRVPVMHRMSGGKERCVGMVTLDDLIASRDINDYYLMRVVRAQILRRMKFSGERRKGLRIAEAGARSRGVDPSEENLYHAISLATRLPEERSRELLKTVLKAFYRRLHHTAAVRMATTLPAEIRDELLDIAPGPDRLVTAPRLVSDVMESFGFSQPDARTHIAETCRVLEEWVGSDRFSHIQHQLPQDLNAFFSREGGPVQRAAA